MAEYLRKECGDLNEVASDNDDDKDNDDDDGNSKGVKTLFFFCFVLFQNENFNIIFHW